GEANVPGRGERSRPYNSWHTDSEGRGPGMSAASSPAPTRATLADLAKTPGKAELIDGRIVHLMPTGLRPNLVAGRIYRSLADHVDVAGQGLALTDNMGF